MFSKAWNWISQRSPISYAIAFYAVVMSLDWISSMLSRSIPGVHESNPFAVDEVGHFVLHKMLVVDTIVFLGLALCAVAVYNVFKYWSKEVGRVVMCIPFLYIAYDRLLDAVIPNFGYVLRLHVVSNQSPILTILHQILNKP